MLAGDVARFMVVNLETSSPSGSSVLFLYYMPHQLACDYRIVTYSY